MKFRNLIFGILSVGIISLFHSCAQDEFGEEEQGAPKPVADFTENTDTIFAGGIIQFTDLSTNDPTSWNWSHPGGTPATSNLQNPAVQYANPGTYNVTLIATNGNGSDTVTKSNHIVVLATGGAGSPVANFSVNNQNVNTGSSAQFTDLSTNNPTSWFWSFPGGSPASSTLENPLIAYNTPGVYDVSLTAVNNNGADVETKTGYIIVSTPGAPPVANFVANNTNISAGSSVNFTDISTNNPTSWSWTFNGGSPASSTQQNPTVTFATAGTYTISLTATNAFGNDVETKTGFIVVTATGAAPVADFQANNTNVTVGTTVNFTDLSTNSPTSWSWSFSGGTPTSSTSQNPSITYNAAGTYMVSLTSSNAFGADNETKTAYITVTNAAPACTSQTTGDCIADYAYCPATSCNIDLTSATNSNEPFLSQGTTADNNDIWLWLPVTNGVTKTFTISAQVGFDGVIEFYRANNFAQVSTNLIFISQADTYASNGAESLTYTSTGTGYIVVRILDYNNNYQGIVTTTYN